MKKKSIEQSWIERLSQASWCMLVHDTVEINKNKYKNTESKKIRKPKRK